MQPLGACPFEPQTGASIGFQYRIRLPTQCSQRTKPSETPAPGTRLILSLARALLYSPEFMLPADEARAIAAKFQINKPIYLEPFKGRGNINLETYFVTAG